MLKIYCEFQMRYNYDLYFSIGNRNPLQVTDVIGYDGYKIENEQIVFPDSEVKMREDEYPVLIEKGMIKFYFENIIPRIGKFKDQQDAIEKLARMAEEEQKELNYVSNWTKQFTEGFGCVMSNPVGSLCSGTIMLFNYLRGMKGFATDMRRRPALVKEASQVIFNVCGGFRAFDKYKGEQTDWAFPVSFSCLEHTVMNPKQFGEFIWPYMEVFIKKVTDMDITGYFFCEGGVSNMLDYLKEAPSGHFMLWQEMDDIRMLKKELPQLAHAGGMPVDILGSATPEKCVDYAKGLIDDIGFDGKYIFCTNKFPTYKNDCNRENLTAVLDFIRDYGVYNK